MFLSSVAVLQVLELHLMLSHAVIRSLSLRKLIFRVGRVVNQPSLRMEVSAISPNLILPWYMKLWLSVALCCKTPPTWYVRWVLSYLSMREIDILSVCPLLHQAELA